MTRRAWWHVAAFILCCVLATLAAAALKPHRRMAELSRSVTLERAIPKSFEGWQEVDDTHRFLVNPQQQELLGALYSQLVSRTYRNVAGDTVMLSISYGGQQGNDVELHRPEICYVAQGFSLVKNGRVNIDVGQGNAQVGALRLLARQGQRIEPISYWMRVGDQVIPSGYRQQWLRIQYGLEGWIPDGVLFRVSSINADTQHGYAMQEAFAAALLRAVDLPTRRMLIGPVRTVAEKGA